jgi:hypothetical protein
MRPITTRLQRVNSFLGRVPASLWFFLAGLVSSVATSFIAAIPSAGKLAFRYLVSSGPWLLTALLLVWLGITMEDIRRNIDRMLPRSLTTAESRLVEESVRGDVSLRASFLVLLTIISMGISVFCTWWLFHKGGTVRRPVERHLQRGQS